MPRFTTMENGELLTDNRPPLSVAVVIPTYNRRDSLCRALDSLRQQDDPGYCLEVIVVDDGSTDGTAGLDWGSWPFPVRYYFQENSGVTVARNAGASHSSSAILTFMDDDMVAAAGMLAHLIQVVCSSSKVIALATLILVPDNRNSFATLYSSGAVFPRDVEHPTSLPGQEPAGVPTGGWVHFSNCKTGMLCIKAEDFYALSMFQDPTGGWPNWDDVDFGYRADRQGYRLYRSEDAIAYHHDRSLNSLDVACRRHHQAARAAAHLLHRYPDLGPSLSTYHDKGPLSLRRDSPQLAARKMLRTVVSSASSVAAMKWLAHLLQVRRSNSLMLARLYRWIISADIYHGYRQGLRELKEGAA